MILRRETLCRGKEKEMMVLQSAEKTYQSRQKIGLYRYMLLFLLALGMQPVCAETIVIGAGKGVVWEGLPFSGSLTGPLRSPTLLDISLVSIGTAINVCAFDPPAVAGRINGVLGLQLIPGVIIVPRVQVSGHFFRYNGRKATFSGTIGLPANSIVVADRNRQMYKFDWCFGPEGNRSKFNLWYYDQSRPRVVDYAGSWVIIADGSQVSQDNISVPPFYFGSYGEDPRGHRYKQILPTSLNLRVSTLQCTVATELNVNFGQVQRNTQSGEELARLSFPLNIFCSQPASQIAANINVQFRAISGLFESHPARLALAQGGAYITGEIDSGVTGSGVCTSSNGILFDNTRFEVGKITSTEMSKVTSNQVTWRLCSGGASLPAGAVNAAAEMLVTFN